MVGHSGSGVSSSSFLFVDGNEPYSSQVSPQACDSCDFPMDCLRRCYPILHVRSIDSIYNVRSCCITDVHSQPICVCKGWEFVCMISLDNPGIGLSLLTCSRLKVSQKKLNETETSCSNELVAEADDFW